MKFIIEYQDQFFKWHRYGEQHNLTSACRTAKGRSIQSGKKYRVLSSNVIFEVENARSRASVDEIS